MTGSITRATVKAATEEAVGGQGRRASRRQGSTPGPAVPFEALIEAQQETITRLTYRLLGWRKEEVEDVVQEVFLSAWQHWGRFRGECEVGTWLIRIAVNKCRSWHRKCFLRIKLQRSLKGGAGERRGVTSPEQTMISSEQVVEIHQAVRALPAKLREVMVLRYLEGHTIEQTAAILKVPTNTVNVRLSRGRERLRTKLGKIRREQE